MTDSIEINRASWDERVPAHVASPGYKVARFTEDPAFLSRVVEFDRPRLGDISGLDGVHLQCHIGTDTVSLARLGAHMTGLDFSEPAIEAARSLAEATGADARFVVSELYDAPATLGPERFDLVYTGIGAICWLPDIRRWAEVVAALLRPGGRLFIREGHPMLWTIDEKRTDVLSVELAYFETPEPLVWDEGGTYVETDVEFETTLTHSWSHGLGETVTAVLDAGMEITGLEEHTTVPWDALPGQLETAENGELQLRERRERLPLTFTLQARKR
jgi:SAM-dependent methyltransferase